MLFGLTLILYLLDSLVYMYKNIYNIDLYSSQIVNNYFFILKTLICIILIINISLHKKKINYFSIVYYLFIISSLLAYIFNEFIFRYFVRDTVSYILYPLLIYSLLLYETKNKENKFLQIFKFLLFFHVLGVLIFAILNYNFQIIYNKIFIDPFSFKGR